MKRTATQNSRDALVLEHLEWARGIARFIATLLPTWFTADDLVGPVEVALVRVAEQYDPARQVPFRAFALRRIYGACFDSCRRREYVERGHQTAENIEVRSADPSPEEQAEAAEHCRVWARVQRLPSRHAVVILGVYGGGMKLVELSGLVGVGPARLSQIHTEALGMLRETCGEWEKAA